LHFAPARFVRSPQKKKKRTKEKTKNKKKKTPPKKKKKSNKTNTGYSSVFEAVAGRRFAIIGPSLAQGDPQHRRLGRFRWQIILLWLAVDERAMRAWAMVSCGAGLTALVLVWTAVAGWAAAGQKPGRSRRGTRSLNRLLVAVIASAQKLCAVPIALDRIDPADVSNRRQGSEFGQSEMPRRRHASGRKARPSAAPTAFLTWLKCSLDRRP